MSAKFAVTDEFRLQDSQYEFPYHYVPRFVNGKFTWLYTLPWGHEYMSYLEACSQRLAALEWNSLLDVGCGDGRLASILKARFPDREIFGVDASVRAVNLGQALTPGGNLIAGDITNTDVFSGRQFDVLTCVEVLEHIEPDFLSTFVTGMRQHAKPGARLLVTVPCSNTPVQKKHFQHFTGDSLTKVLAGYFSPLDISYLNGEDSALRLAQKIMRNRFFSITEPLLLDAFYKWYVRRYLHSTAIEGRRVIGLFQAI